MAAVEPVMGELEPRASGRAIPVTPWRRQVASLADEISKTIFDNENAERRYQTARETAEDIVHTIRQHLRAEFGRVFDPLIDGPHG